MVGGCVTCQHIQSLTSDTQSLPHQVMSGRRASFVSRVNLVGKVCLLMGASQYRDYVTSRNLVYTLVMANNISMMTVVILVVFVVVVVDDCGSSGR